MVRQMASAAEAKEMAEWLKAKEAVPRYLATLTEEEKIGHEIAVEMLATSYTVERSRGFRAWWAAEAKKASNQAQSPPSKK
jgi:hypothetical protein